MPASERGGVPWVPPALSPRSAPRPEPAWLVGANRIGFVLLFVGIGCLLAWITPVFTEVYEQVDLGLPRPTQTLMAIPPSGYVGLGVLAAAAFIGTDRWFATPSSRRLREGILLAGLFLLGGFIVISLSMPFLITLQGIPSR